MLSCFEALIFRGNCSLCPPGDMFQSCRGLCCLAHCFANNGHG
uniref:Uncharacterized protein n=1 Tax=Anguilla anguilla TaxID=7936 RepID=A0A0E9SJD2_ANGAN